MLLNYIAVVIDVVLMFIILISANKEKKWEIVKYGYCLFFLSYLMNLVALINKW